MKIQRSSSKSGLFLVELIIAITFFAVSSAICIQLFVTAHTISTRSSDMGAAALLAQGYAEQYKAMGYEQKQSIFYGDEQAHVEQYYYGFDRTNRLTLLEPNRRDDAVYLLSVVHEEDFLPTMTARIHVYRYDGQLHNDESVALFSLDVKSYGPVQ